MPGKVAAIAETDWATRERVLEQPVPVGLVVALGGGRVAEAAPGLRVRAEHARRAARAGAGSGPCATSSRRSASICAASRGGPSSSVGAVDLVASRAARSARTRSARRSAGAPRSGPGRAPRRRARTRRQRRRRRPARRRRPCPCGRRASAAGTALPSRFVRSSRSRTSRTQSSSWPSVSSRTTMGRNVDPGSDRMARVRDSVRPVDRTALITGGTGGLGRAVVAAFARARLARRRARQARRATCQGAEVVQADLTDADDVARAVGAAAGDAGAPLRAVANLVGGFAAGQPVADTPVGRVRGPVRAQPAPDLPRHAGRAAGARRRGRRRDRVRLVALGAAPVRGRPPATAPPRRP